MHQSPPPKKHERSLISMLPLFLVLFIDGMGLGLLFPILSAIFIDHTSTFIAHATSSAHRELLYSITVAIFMLCWFFGATILGDISDIIGRKKALMICLIGAFLSYLLSAIAMFFDSISLLMIGRVIAGFTAGSQPIAQAAIVDISSEQHKARNIGLILLSVSLGFVFGPIIGGILSDHHLVAWFSFATPMYFASIISLINAVLLYTTFDETFQVTRTGSIKLHRAIEVFLSAFKHHKISWLSLCLLVLIFGWSNYFSFISMFVLVRFHYTSLQSSFFLALLGMGFSLGCSWLVDYCAQRFHKKNTIAVSSIICAVCAGITALSYNQYVVGLLALMIGTAMAVSYSTILVVFSNQVSDTEQGWIMGVTGSIMALCFGLTTFFTGFVVSFGVNIPMWLAAAGLLLSGIMIHRASKSAN